MEPLKNGSLALIDAVTPEPRSVRFCGGEAVVFSRRKPGATGTNGDSIALVETSERSGVILLADGAGGTPGGNKASGFVVERMLRFIASTENRRASLRDRILDGLETANRELVARASGAATTLFALELQDGRVRPYHVGDSIILVVGGRGKRLLQTISHSPTGYAVEAGMMKEAEALQDETNFVVSNLVGSKDMRIEMGGPLELRPADTVLMASDGLTDNLTTDEVTEIIRKGPLDRAAAQLVSIADGRMRGTLKAPYSKPDDLSFVLFRIS